MFCRWKAHNLVAHSAFHVVVQRERWLDEGLVQACGIELQTGDIAFCASVWGNLAWTDPLDGVATGRHRNDGWADLRYGGSVVDAIQTSDGTADGGVGQSWAAVQWPCLGNFGTRVPMID